MRDGFIGSLEYCALPAPHVGNGVPGRESHFSALCPKAVRRKRRLETNMTLQEIALFHRPLPWRKVRGLWMLRPVRSAETYTKGT
ncbi:MAG: hypothetical protein QF593_07505, partial [Nitrospinota bacterium]|nr:hypothetical protein [Nitrospinota bacterium]